MEGFLYDLKQAARGLMRSPVFTVTAVFTLALGIGANTTAFSVLNAVLLKPLPFAEPDRLVMVWETNAERKRDRNVVSPANFLDWQRASSSFSGMAAFSEWRMSVTGFGEPEQLYISYTTPSFFSLLGVRPLLGRALEPADDRDGVPLVTVLSHRLWQRKFGGDSSIVGKSVTLGGRPRMVVGIMPAAFGFPESKAELWLPLGLDPTVNYRERSGRFMSAFARLRPGVTVSHAQADLSTIAKRLEAEYPQFNATWGVRVVPMLEDVVGPTRRALVIVSCAVALVLLIACANVANLLLVRASSRSREIAMRAALGAGRGRMARLLLLESLVLSIVAGGLGLMFAIWGTSALSAFASSFLPRAASIGIDLGALGFTIGLSVLTAVLFGSFPAWRTARADLNALVQRGSRQTAHGMRARYALVSGQVALTLMLLIGAGLLGKSFLRLSAVNPGFDPEDVLTFRIELPTARYDSAHKSAAFFERLLRDVRAVPEVRSAGAINWLPMSGLSSRTSVFVEGRPVPPPGQELGADVRAVDPEFFRTMRVPIIKGEGLSPRLTADVPRSIVITEMTARAWFGNADPIGRYILMPWGDTLRGRIVGVVGDIHHSSLDSLPRTTVYWALAQFPSQFMSVVVRTTGDPLAAVPSIREVVRRIDPNIPMAEIKPMSAYVGDSVARRRFFTTALGVFAALALTLAIVGLYGALAFSVAQRTREIGVRVALGAQRDAVLGMVLREGLRVTGFGLAVGALGALAATRVLSTMLYGVGPRDAATFGLTAVLLVGIALIASYVPARRALAVDPVEALRQE
jgi:putative ABC transport system permease protein